jgi:hypothetical protein
MILRCLHARTSSISFGPQSGGGAGSGGGWGLARRRSRGCAVVYSKASRTDVPLVHDAVALPQLR